jgi:hypothetical protein
MPLDVLIGRDIPGRPMWPALAASAVGLVMLVLLASRWGRHSLALARVSFVLNAAAIIFALWLTAVPDIASGRVATPFQAHKLAILVVALLAPDVTVGLLCIAGYAGTAIGRYALFDPAMRERVSAGEPWVLVAYTLVGATLLVYRLRGFAMELRMHRAQAEAAALDDLARTLLIMRDLANTPLQTIELNLALMRRRAPQVEPMLGRIDRALDRLRELNEILTRHEARLGWDTRDESAG